MFWIKTYHSLLFMLQYVWLNGGLMTSFMHFWWNSICQLITLGVGKLASMISGHPEMVE